MILVGYNQDEEYQIVMAYRSIAGDSLFCNMWEPHQMSAFLCAFLEFLFIKITGSTTGIVIFLRIAGVFIQSIIAFILFGTLKKYYEKEQAFLISIIFFNMTPKMFASPEFSNMQFWAISLTLIFFFNFFANGIDSSKGRMFLVFSAVSFSLSILSYPSMLLLAPVYFVLLFSFYKGKDRASSLILFFVPCLILGMAYVGFHICNVGWTSFKYALKAIPYSDLTHQTGINTLGNSKVRSNLKDIFEYSLFTAITFFISFLIMKVRKKDTLEKSLILPTLSFSISLLFPLFFWICLGQGYEAGQVHILVAMICVLLLAFQKEKRIKHFYILCSITALFTLVSVLIATDMTFFSTIGHSVFIIIPMMTLICDSFNKAEMKKQAFLFLLCISLFFILSRAFVLRGGSSKNNVFAVENVCRSGPAKGIFAEYMRTYIMDKNYEEWDSVINKGDCVLIVTNTLHSDITTSYLFKDVNISHYSVINPAAYDERLLEYWERFPDKYPDVIVIDCWYGNPLFSEDTWIMKFLSNDYNAHEIIDKSYLRFYKK